MYNGEERRHLNSGRRTSDRDFCAEHHIIQEDKKEHRNMVCNKIKTLREETNTDISRVDEEIKNVHRKVETIKDLMIGKYWFRIVISGVCAAILYIGFQQNWAFKEIIGNQKEFAVAVNNIENKQIEMNGQMKTFEIEIKDLTKRQDILRDINIKQRDNVKEK